LKFRSEASDDYNSIAELDNGDSNSTAQSDNGDSNSTAQSDDGKPPCQGQVHYIRNADEVSTGTETLPKTI